jgi:membrane glycosyltransferase
LIVKRGQAKRFGGVACLATSIVLEIILSTLLAPLRMWFHAKFVLLTLLGRPIKWNAQQRTASGTTWFEALRAHGVATLLASAWIAAVAWFDPAVFVWLLPVAIPLLLSIPLSVYSSRVSFGGAGRHLHLFQIPEENSPPPLIDRLRSLLGECKPQSLSQNVIDSDARGKPLHSAQRAASTPRIHAEVAEPLPE